VNDIAVSSRTERQQAIAKLVAAGVAPELRSTLQDFIARYYAQVDPEDLQERLPADLYGAALSHWNFARKRVPGEARVRAFNPTIEDQGWLSTHTIVEIVNDDMPFLVDSVAMEANRHGLTLHLIVHPIIAVERSADGTLLGLASDDSPTRIVESFIHLEVDRTIDAAALHQLVTDITHVLADVRAAVRDWKAMRDKAHAIANAVRNSPPAPLRPDQVAEGVAFIEWLADNHFTFLGYRCHDLVRIDGQDALQIQPGTSLGILAEPRSKDVAGSFAALPPEVRAYARRPELLVITKSTSRSTVHRPGFLDYIAIKRFDNDGHVCGEHRFLGLFAHGAYSANPSEIPLLRNKTADVIRKANLPAGGHAEKQLINILDNYPRDELFQISEIGRAHV